MAQGSGLRAQGTGRRLKMLKRLIKLIEFIKFIEFKPFAVNRLPFTVYLLPLPNILHLATFLLFLQLNLIRCKYYSQFLLEEDWAV